MRWRWKIAQAAEIRWWQGYLKKKGKQEYIDWKSAYWRDFLKQCQLSLPVGARCLDAGCGPAGIFMVLDQQQVDAVDPLLDSYSEKIKHFDKEDYPKTNFISSPLEHFEQKEPYDYVFCLNAINHVSDLALCFDRLFALTASQGQLIVSIDAHNHSAFKHIFRLLPGDILHPHQYDLQEYKKMLIDRGGQVLREIRMKKAFFFDYYVLIVQK